MATWPGAAEPTLHRAHLLKRVDDARAQILSIVAPAGYGKTMLARRLTPADAMVCDCGGLRSAVDLAAAVVRGVSAVVTEHIPSLVRYEMTLRPQTAADAATKIALGALALLPCDRLMFFENVEHIEGVPDCAAMLSQLLAAHGERRVILCSRVPMPVRLHRFAPLNRILRVGADDLRFEYEEIAEILQGCSDDSASIRKVESTTGGWPIAVQLIRSLAEQSSLTEVLHRSDDAEFDDLYEYLADEVLATLSPAQADVVGFCAAVPDATDEEIAAVFGDSARAEAAGFALRSPFLRRGSATTFEVHPMLRSMIRARHTAAVTGYVRRAIVHAQGRDAIREARLRLELGDDEGAASVLERMTADGLHEAPSVDYAQIVSRLDRRTLLKYPMLWSTGSLYNALINAPAAHFADATAVWRRNQSAPPAVFPNVASAFLSAAIVTSGHREEAQAALQVFAAHVASKPDDIVALQTLRAWQAAFAAVTGRNTEALAIWSEIEPVFLGINSTYALSQYDIVARVARARGDRGAERKALAEAADAAERSGLSTIRAVVFIDSLFSAWFHGEEYAQDLIRLESCIDPMNERGIAGFIACVRGDHADATFEAGPVKTRAYGYLIAASLCADDREALECARNALVAADASANVFLSILARVALAVLDSRRREEHCDVARRLASDFDSAPLQNALAHFENQSEHCGMLNPFIARISQHRSSAAFEVSVLAGRVTINAADAGLTARETELVCALACEPKPRTLSDLALRIHPDRECHAATNLVKVLIHRVRNKLGRESIIAGKHGYSIGAAARVDIVDLERALRKMLSSLDVSTLRAQLDVLRRAAQQLAIGQSFEMARWEWIAPVVGRLSALLLAQTVQAGRSLLKVGEFDDAVDLAHIAAAIEPCDESARELAIAAYLGAGDRAAALREFLDYQTTLKRELNMAASSHLTKMIAQAAAS
ncbi:MAG: BTAD domain-containing putative transcriptional regulator [Burkholderiales bacterium]